MRPLLFAALLAAATNAFAQDATQWFFQARAEARRGDVPATVKALEKVLEAGDGFLPPIDGFEKVWEAPAFKEVRARMEAKLPRLDYAPAAFELDDRGLIPEGIAYDAPSRSFFIGSVAARKVVRVAEDGTVTDFTTPAAELDAVLGVAVDAPRRILYLVTTNALSVAGRKAPRNAVVGYDIDTRRRIGRFDIPEAKQLNDVAVAPGGRVFASDSTSGAVFEVAVKGPGASRTVVPAGKLRGSNGLAASPDAKRLYIAHATGIAIYDVERYELKDLANPTRETIGAIDGLYARGGDLIGVQNVTNPGRVIRIALNAAGDAVHEVKTLLSHHHNQLDEPTTAAVTDRGIFLLATTGFARLDENAAVRDPATAPKPVVLRIP